MYVYIESRFCKKQRFEEFIFISRLPSIMPVLFENQLVHTANVGKYSRARKVKLKITHRTFIEHEINHIVFYPFAMQLNFPTWMKSSFQNYQFGFHVAVDILYKNLGDYNPWISKRQFEHFSSDFWAVLITQKVIFFWVNFCIFVAGNEIFKSLWDELLFGNNCILSWLMAELGAVETCRLNVHCGLIYYQDYLYS